jgi:hypothetical protein
MSSSKTGGFACIREAADNYAAIAADPEAAVAWRAEIAA